jgi:hypothetical protein
MCRGPERNRPTGGVTIVLAVRTSSAISLTGTLVTVDYCQLKASPLFRSVALHRIEPMAMHADPYTTSRTRGKRRRSTRTLNVAGQHVHHRYWTCAFMPLRRLVRT